MLSSFLGQNKSDQNKSYKTSKEGQGKVISFINQKGGVGKTTMAFNTAYALKKRGAKVLCMDLDPQANLTLLFAGEKEIEYGMHQLMINSVRELKALHAPALLSDVLISGDVDLLPSGQDLSGFELSVAGISSPRQLILNKFIQKNALREKYDYIVIDGPPTLGLLVVNILCSSDGVMVPFRPDEFSRKGLTHFYDVLENIEDMGVTKTPQVIGYIPNLVDARRKQEGLDLGRIREEFSVGKDTPLMNPFYNRAQLVKSQAQRKSVFGYESIEYRPLQEQFLEIADRIGEWERRL